MLPLIGERFQSKARHGVALGQTRAAKLKSRPSQAESTLGSQQKTPQNCLWRCKTRRCLSGSYYLSVTGLVSLSQAAPVSISPLGHKRCTDVRNSEGLKSRHGASSETTMGHEASIISWVHFLIKTLARWLVPAFLYLNAHMLTF